MSALRSIGQRTDVIMIIEQDEVQEWIGQLRSGDMDQQREASRRIGAAGEVAVTPVLAALANSADNDQRWYLAVALARIGRPAVDPLVTALRERRDPEFRRYAAAALAALGEDAVDPLVRLLEVEDDTELRGFAAQALTRIGEPAIDSLREAVEAGGSLGAVAGLVLWQMEEPGIQALVSVCSPEDGQSAVKRRRTRAPGPEGFYRICREPGCSPRSWIRLAVQDQFQVRDHDMDRQQACKVLDLHAIDLRREERRAKVGKVLRKSVQHAGLSPGHLSLVGLERRENVPGEDLDLPLPEPADQPLARGPLRVPDHHDLAREDEEDRDESEPGDGRLRLPDHTEREPG